TLSITAPSSESAVKPDSIPTSRSQKNSSAPSSSSTPLPTRSPPSEASYPPSPTGQISEDSVRYLETSCTTLSAPVSTTSTVNSTPLSEKQPSLSMSSALSAATSTSTNSK